MKLGIIARMDDTGLGNQTRNLVKMLNPDKILVINSKTFNGNEQHPEWYKDYNVQESRGFPDTSESIRFLKGLDAVLTCELPYNWVIFSQARVQGIKTLLQYNYEFLDYLGKSGLPFPTWMLSPSAWHYEEMEEKFGGRSRFLKLPPPLDYAQFEEARKINLSRTGKRRYVHIVGRQAIHDRNGTAIFLESINHLQHENIEVVLKSQTRVPRSVMEKCKYKVTLDLSCPKDEADLYKNFDAIIMPRRYGGLCLPMNEALASGLPVIMPDIEPNNDVLPADWLVPAEKTGEFQARSIIDIHSADPEAIAAKIDEFTQMPGHVLREKKNHAAELGKRFSYEFLEPKYRKVLDAAT